MNGVMGELMMLMAPLADDVHMSGRLVLTTSASRMFAGFLRSSWRVCDRMLRWLIDPENSWTLPPWRAVLRQVQAHSAMHLLFADIAAMNYSATCTPPHQLRMLWLDKTANLRVELGVRRRLKAMLSRRRAWFSQREDLVRSSKMPMQLLVTTIWPERSRAR